MGGWPFFESRTAIMLFNKPPARSRPGVGHKSSPRPLGPRPNGPDTPLMEPAAPTRALRHAA
jgi:hypothetical protein